MYAFLLTVMFLTLLQGGCLLNVLAPYVEPLLCFGFMLVLEVNVIYARLAWPTFKPVNDTERGAKTGLRNGRKTYYWPIRSMIHGCEDGVGICIHFFTKFAYFKI